MESRVESAGTAGFLWPAPDNAVLWMLAFALARCRTINIRDFRIATGPFAWLFLHAAIPILRTIKLLSKGVTIRHINKEEVVTKIPGRGVDVIMQRFAIAEHLSSSPEGVVLTMKKGCSCGKYDFT